MKNTSTNYEANSFYNFTKLWNIGVIFHCCSRSYFCVCYWEIKNWNEFYKFNYSILSLFSLQYFGVIYDPVFCWLFSFLSFCLETKTNKHGPWQYGWSLPRRIVVRGLPEMTLVHFFLPWAYTKFGFIEPFGYLS